MSTLKNLGEKWKSVQSVVFALFETLKLKGLFGPEKGNKLIWAGPGHVESALAVADSVTFDSNKT